MKTRMKNGRPLPTSLHTRNFPEGLRERFSYWCDGMGYTMQGVVIAGMRRVLHDDKAIPAARQGHPKTTQTLHTRSVPPHLKAQFKAWCARRGYTMEAVIIVWVKRVLREDKRVADAETPNRPGG